LFYYYQILTAFNSFKFFVSVFGRSRTSSGTICKFLKAVSIW
jgi:hypothetical protein